jgi:hypothetical protein
MRTPVTLPTEPARASAPAWERTYPGTACRVRLVRAAVRSLLDGCSAADDAVLVVSELAPTRSLTAPAARPAAPSPSASSTRAGTRSAPRSGIRAATGTVTWDGDLGRGHRDQLPRQLLLTQMPT